MDIKSLSDFIILSDCKSFSKAAVLCHITQPAFSRRIQTLEDAVGADLIDRQSKNFKLTAAGERFLIHARQLVELAGRAAEEAKTAITRLSDPLYIVAPSYISKTFFPAWYKAMQKEIHGLTMRISNKRGSATLEDLRKGLADFALVLHAKIVKPCYDFEGLQVHTIGTDRIIAVCSKQTKNADHLLMYERDSYMNACADAVLKKKASSGKVGFESSSTGLLKEMALAGFGVAVLPESVAEDDVVQGYLTPVKGTVILECDILLVRKASALNKKAEKMWDINKSRIFPKK